MSLEKKHKTILLVEDEVITAQVEIGQLKNAGYNVIHAYSGELAVEMVIEKDILVDLILMDIDLGKGLDGPEAAKKILQYKDIPIIFLSSHVEKDVVEKTEFITSYGYVVKNTGEVVLTASIRMAFKLFSARKKIDIKKMEIEAVNEELQSSMEELESANEEYEATNEELLTSQKEIMTYAESLREREEHFRSLFELLPVVVMIHKNNIVDMVNSECVRMFRGSSINDFIGVNVLDLFDKSEIKNFEARQIEKKNLERSAPEHYFAKLKRLNGETFPVEIFSVDITYHKEPASLVAVFDITDRKQAESELNDSIANLNRSQAISHVGSWCLNIPNNEFSASDEAYRLMGFPMKSKLSFTDVAVQIHPDDRPLAHEVLMSSLKTGKPYSIEIRILKKDTGEMRYLLSQAEIEMSAEGRPVKVFGINQDITDRHILEEQLRQSDKMRAIGQLAGGIAHDFNNQLTGITGYAEMIRLSFPENEKIRNYVEKILTSVKRAADLTSKLLAFARKGKFLTVRVDVHEIIEEVVSILHHSIDKKISLVTDLAENKIYVKGDPSQLQNAVLNIALNARDSMLNGGVITFSAREIDLDKEYCSKDSYGAKPGRYIGISVSDTGAGMDMQLQKHIFEPFFTTKKQGAGSGMGLPSVYGTVKNHKGSIMINSVPDKGTDFTIYVPAYLSNIEELEFDVKEINVPKKKLKVLIVDDEEMITVMINEMLTISGHEVVKCNNGSGAVEIYRNIWQELDLVILDMVMPVMNGSETYFEMKKINPDVKALLLSGYSVDGDAQKLLNEGACGFMQKPFSSQELLKKIAEVI